MLTRIVIFIFVVQWATLSASAASLSGSKASVNRMARQARLHGFTRLPDGEMLKDFVKNELLVLMEGNNDYHVDGQVSHPYVRPAVKTFVERLSAQSRATCPNGLTLTSLTRPIDEQPNNASAKSVHPTGMGIDFHVPTERQCKAWLENTTLKLEDINVLEVTLERSPPHYHVAVYPNPYTAYLARKSDKAKVVVTKVQPPAKAKPKPKAKDKKREVIVIKILPPKAKAKTRPPKRAPARNKGKRK